MINLKFKFSRLITIEISHFDKCYDSNFRFLLTSIFILLFFCAIINGPNF